MNHALTRTDYEGPNGWADGRLGLAYDLVAEFLRDRGESAVKNPLLDAIEQADIDLKEGVSA